MDYFKVKLGPPYHLICKKLRFTIYNNNITIILKYSFSWRWEINVQKPFVLAFGLWIHEFTKNQSRVRFNIQICDLKLWFFCEIYFNEGDVDHERDFCEKISHWEKLNVN